jgi:hypothetical protein
MTHWHEPPPDDMAVRAVRLFGSPLVRAQRAERALRVWRGIAVVLLIMLAAMAISPGGVSSCP